MKALVFYDKMDNDGRGALAILNKFIDSDDFIAIGLDRGLKIDISNNNPNNYFENYLDTLEELVFRGGIKSILFLDLAPRCKEDYKKLVGICLEYKVSLYIIDHHKLNYQINNYINTLDNVEIKYIHDTKYSACALTYFYFTDIKKDINNLPYCVKLIDDRDTFRRNFKESDYLFNTFSFMEQEELNDIILDTSNSCKLQTWLAVGKIKQGSKNKKKEKVKKLAKIGRLLSWNCVYIDEEVEPQLISEVGNELCKTYKDKVNFFITSKYDEKLNKWLYSLRSLNAQALDFIKYNNFQGGGHPNACGFTHSENILNLVTPLNK